MKTTPNKYADAERALLHYADGHELPAPHVAEIMTAAADLDRVYLAQLEAAAVPVRLHSGQAHIDAMTAAKQALRAGRCLIALHNLAHAERIRSLEFTLSTFKDVNK